MIKRFLAAIFICFFAVAPSFAAVSVIASAKNNTEAAGASITVTHGFTLQNDDVLFAIVALGKDTGTGWSSSSGGAWTVLANFDVDQGNDIDIAALRRVVTDAGSEPASYTFTRDGGTSGWSRVAIVVQIRGADTTTPEDATTVGGQGTNDFTPDQTDITTATANAAVLISHQGSMLGQQGGYTGAETKTAGAPSGYTLVDSEVHPRTDTNFVAVFLEVAVLADAGAAGLQSPGVWTGTPDDTVSEFGLITIAIKQAAVTGSAVLIGNQPKFLD